MHQRIVGASPSARLVLARKPKYRSARLVSNTRRGWPFGFEVSRTNRP
jgi:hypothetical protein